MTGWRVTIKRHAPRIIEHELDKRGQRQTADTFPHLSTSISMSPSVEALLRLIIDNNASGHFHLINQEDLTAII